MMGAGHLFVGEWVDASSNNCRAAIVLLALRCAKQPISAMKGACSSVQVLDLNQTSISSPTLLSFPQIKLANNRPSRASGAVGSSSMALLKSAAADSKRRVRELMLPRSCQADALVGSNRILASASARAFSN